MQAITDKIIIKNLSKKYNKKLIIDKANHEFSLGQSIAFMGHNGCGKSTLLKMVAKLVAPTSGNVMYDRPLHFSYVPEKFMPVNMSSFTFLRRICEIEKIKPNQINERITSLADDFFVSEMLDTSMRMLSKGTLQKIGVIQALLQKMDVLILDEPLSGQDIDSQKVFIEKINKLRNQGVTIFMSCHEQNLVKAISEQVFTIENGKLLSYKPMTKHIYTVLVENKLQKPIPEKMERYGAGYRILVDEKDLQDVILQLLTEGWILKGVYEEDAQISKI